MTRNIWARVAGCWMAAAWIAQAQAAPVQDFGEPNLARLAARLSLQDGSQPPVRIMQFGDSHTAADYMSGELRAQLQGRFGDAGIGWLPPLNVSGQRNALAYIRSEGWTLRNSRFDADAAYPLGGFVGVAQRVGAQLRVAPRAEEAGLWRVRVWMRQRADGQALTVDDGNGARRAQVSASGNWQAVEMKLRLPFSIRAETFPAPEVGGYELEKLAPGVVLDSVGSNGAEQSLWRRWGEEWGRQLGAREADLVLLAYGTNEAFDAKLDLDEYRATVQGAIRLVRAQLPQAAILLVGAPDSARRKGAVSRECAGPGRPAMLSAVQQAQRELARDNHLLYWDWEQAMGGPCSMPQWQRRQLGRPDLVHFTQAGYTRLGDDLYQGLLQRLAR
ncbi:SGNH/GDSL hydrolase family protein [Chromobacterium sp. IIBBL 290-4]|uniref:SGNH/GDSL hydrolase family protein n=1 Tax=Chromobacterium sp. IIBBL 290-4 TaxID=2953890 RepID=UPI0020B79BEF|nr:SGNH/GDSL hydrolase family protein [Chromobacterium sp. IIBBL 290-4]UTH76531.1 SGNH/GDSL hydrolase family protein [Chromobacterium sp. IIBBL 290-4]